MQVRDIMSTQPEVVQPSSTLQEAAEKMKVLDSGVMPVCEGERLVGIVTDRDITVRMTAEGAGPDARDEEAMTPEVQYCFEDQDVQEAADLMKENQIRRLPVLDRTHKLVGIVSLGDLVLESSPALATDVLEEVSEPLDDAS